MPHPTINLSMSAGQPIGHNFIELQSVDSTNNYAMAQIHAGLALPGAAYFAYEQVAGKGQRGKSWITAPGENIVLSIVLKPDFLAPSQQFLLAVSIALGCYDFLIKYVPWGWTIKWPNDLYWRDRKAGGILIESICKGNDWLFAVVGIGININQVQFPEPVTHAVSLKQITGKSFDASTLAKELCQFLQVRYTALKEIGQAELLSEYNSLLFKRDQSVKLKNGNVVFETTVKGVSPGGQLLTFDTTDRSFDLGEVEWIVANVEM